MPYLSHSRSISSVLDSFLRGQADCSLRQVMQDPFLLESFESYLAKNWSQRNLLFIEAVNQLRRESGTSKDIEQAFFRIYDTFIATGAPLELNITTQTFVKEQLCSLQWNVVSRNDALTILNTTEKEVLTMLMNKVSEFLETPLAKAREKSKCKNDPINPLKKRVVIIGGGFTGFTVASLLDPMPLFHVTLIDTKDSFEYTPHIVAKIVDPENSSSLRFPHDSYIKNGRVIIGYAEDIYNDAKCVKVNGEEVCFDYLVIATGTSYASQLKSNDSSLYRAIGLSKVANDIASAKQVLIIGAGLVGCELATAIALKKFSGPYPKKKIVLVEARNELMHRASAKQKSTERRLLEKLGIDIVLNEKIEIVHEQGSTDIYRSKSCKVEYPANDYLVFTTTGVKVNTEMLVNCTNMPPFDICLDSSNKLIRVKPTLQLEHCEYGHIFAGGDITNVKEEKTAYAATIAGVCIARNICRIVKGKEPIPQGTKGLLPPPTETLHDIKPHRGLGKDIYVQEQLNHFEKAFSFINPTWKLLKYFNAKQFHSIIQNICQNRTLGKTPRLLTLTETADSTRSKKDLSFTFGHHCAKDK